ncbi:MAG: hypothetical protein AB9907_17560 [Flexilinea sp.]
MGRLLLSCNGRQNIKESADVKPRKSVAVNGFEIVYVTAGQDGCSFFRVDRQVHRSGFRANGADHFSDQVGGFRCLANLAMGCPPGQIDDGAVRAGEEERMAEGLSGYDAVIVFFQGWAPFF